MKSTSATAPPPPAASARDPGLTVEQLLDHPHEVLKDEGDHAARVLKVQLPDGPVVFKEWAPATSRLLRFWAGTLMRREIRHYELLRDVPGIPRIQRAFGEEAFLIEFVEGQPLGRRMPAELVARAMDELEGLLDRLAERRFAHLDLHQKQNLLIGDGGQIWLIDLGQGLDCSRGWFRRLLFPLLHRIDRKAVTKFRARYAPDSLDGALSDAAVHHHARRRGRRWKNFHRRLRTLLVGEKR